MRILILGGGKSTLFLASYLCDLAPNRGWEVVLIEKNKKALEKFKSIAHLRTKTEDLEDNSVLHKEISSSEVVISMLPSAMHIGIARICADLGKHFLTASYMNDEIKALGARFAEKNRLLLMEMGMDPGIDHMIAMQSLDEIRSQGHKIHTYEAFVGALIDPRTDTHNPWRYKFTWSPRQIINSGKEGAHFLYETQHKFIPYQQVFRRFERINIPDVGDFEGYGNRNSMKYQHIYGLDDINTLFRGTLRPKGFCRAWNTFVLTGMTHEGTVFEDAKGLSAAEYVNTFLMYHPIDSIEIKLAHYMRLDMHSEVFEKLRWSGFFERKDLGLTQKQSAADILLHILQKKWDMQQEEKDAVLIWQKIIYQHEKTGKFLQRHIYLYTQGEDGDRTAIAKTVGLPIGIATKLLLEGKIRATGAQIPNTKEFYEPVLKALKTYGIYAKKEEGKAEKIKNFYF